MPELDNLAPSAPRILVGLQCDKRESRLPVLVPEEEARKFAEKHKMTYIECSAHKMIGLKEVFDQALIKAMTPEETRSKKHKCTIA